MSKRSQYSLAWSSAFVLAFAASAAAQSPAASGAGAARLATYEKAPGETYFALSLTPRVAAESVPSREVVVLFDTSASAAGRYRVDALAALQSLLRSMSPNDRVQLIAVDVKAVPMTASLAAPTSADLRAGIAKLEQRTPLGATDMEVGLRAAAAAFSGTAPKTIVYLGDGMSRANMLPPDVFANLVADLTRDQVSVSSYIIGQEQNSQFLAALANQTGGYVQIDSATAQFASAAGDVLGASLNSTVIWPQQTSLPAQFAESYPTSMPPLRSDRDTVLIGKLSGADAGEVSITADVNGKSTVMTWTVSPEKSSVDFAFLPKLVAQSAADRGLSLPTVGSAGLRETAAITLQSADQLAKLGHDALASGNTAGALKVAEAALERDPTNPAAIALREAAAKRAAMRPIAAGAGLASVPPPPTGGDDLVLGERASAPRSLLDEELAESSILPPTEREGVLMSQRIQAEVETGLNDARNQMMTSPDLAEQSLKVLLEQVERAPRLNGEVRKQLRNQIEVAIQQSRRVRTEVEQARAAAEERRVQGAEMLRINQELIVGEQRLKQIMDRFESLMDEQRYTVADQEVLPEIQALTGQENTGVATAATREAVLSAAAVTGGRLQKSTYEIVSVFNRKERGFVDTMYQVELSQIPFPADPPIIYPDAETWNRITEDRKEFGVVSVANTGNSEKRIYAELNNPTNIEFVETSLKDVIVFLSDYHASGPPENRVPLPIVINNRKLEEAAISVDTPITLSLKGVTLRSALRLLLSDLELTYLIEDEVLQITTQDDANSDERLSTKVYQVGDLVVPIRTNNNLFGLGGQGGQNGMGGQGGGFGGGMNGGGGGMGGGGFGGGGGMMGGGGGGFFDVQDDLSIGTKKSTAAKPAVKAPAAERPVVEKPVAVERPKLSSATTKAVRIGPAGDQTWSATDWDQHFADRRVAMNAAKDASPLAAAEMASMRETIRQLMSEKKYDQVAIALQSSLRHGFVDSWMYEALGLAMQASDASPDELERALMSAIDFAESEEQVLFIAAYMSKVGLPARALSLCRQVAVVNPGRPEPYLQGLALAQKLDDVAGIQWACTGVLAQSWSDEQRHYAETAFRTAKMTYERLLAENRKEEAAAFDAAVRKAGIRDCVVQVTWTGKADVDISVEEPSGTVCSLRTPRSTAGGVYLGDVSAEATPATADGYRETYVCGQGFNGTYRVMVRNIWGRPTAGKVTVDVITHYGSDKEKRVHQQIPLAEKNALIEFDLANGRRVEALAEAQVAQVAHIRNDMNRAVLAQQLAGLDNAAAALRFAAAQGVLNGTTTGGTTGGNTGGTPGGGVNPLDFFRRGAVGYRPVITALPEGANFSSNAVISADRRYVRVSPAPTFSQVTDVATFNFNSGAGTNMPQTGGGGGFGGGVGGGGGGGQF